jgi:hypothetical protein
MLRSRISTQEHTQLVNRAARFGTLEVTADGEGLGVARGVALLVELADQIGLTAALSQTLAGTRERRFRADPGRKLRRCGGDTR